MDEIGEREGGREEEGEKGEGLGLIGVISFWDDGCELTTSKRTRAAPCSARKRGRCPIEWRRRPRSLKWNLQHSQGRRWDH
jgi:hypothetical protein